MAGAASRLHLWWEPQLVSQSTPHIPKSPVVILEARPEGGVSCHLVQQLAGSACIRQVNETQLLQDSV